MMKKALIFITLVVLIILLLFLILNKVVLKDDSYQNEIHDLKEKEQLIESITQDINEEYDNNKEQDNNKEEDNNKKDSTNDKKYDQYVVANGYSGASDNVYYTKSNVLYHLTLSTNEIIKVAEGVEKIESSKGTIEVYKGNNFKIFVDDAYLTYID